MLKFYTGDTAEFTFSIVYGGMVADMSAPDLTAANVSFMVKVSDTDPDARAVYTQTIEHPDTNILTFSMAPTTTARLKQGTYKAACKIFYDSGTELTVWQGDIIAIKGVFNG